jgi:hypothetical protein
LLEAVRVGKVVVEALERHVILRKLAPGPPAEEHRGEFTCADGGRKCGDARTRITLDLWRRAKRRIAVKSRVAGRKYLAHAARAKALNNRIGSDGRSGSQFLGPG